MSSEDLAYLRGAITALPTPFRDGVIDLEALDRLVQHQARQRTTAVVVGGATGEGWSLEVDEVGQLVARTVASAEESSDYRLRVIFGVTEVSSERAARVARNAALAGADALLVSAPPFAMPDVKGVIAHLRQILDALPSDLPLITINEPERTGTDLDPEALKEILERVPEVAAHCEAGGRPTRARTLAAELSIPLLAGEDRMIGPMIRNGAQGAITVVGNLVPGEVASFIEATRADDPEGRRAGTQARAAHRRPAHHDQPRAHQGCPRCPRGGAERRASAPPAPRHPPAHRLGAVSDPGAAADPHLSEALSGRRP